MLTIRFIMLTCFVFTFLPVSSVVFAQSDKGTLNSTDVASQEATVTPPTKVERAEKLMENKRRKLARALKKKSKEPFSLVVGTATMMVPDNKEGSKKLAVRRAQLMNLAQLYAKSELVADLNSTMSAETRMETSTLPAANTLNDKQTALEKRLGNVTQKLKEVGTDIGMSEAEIRKVSRFDGDTFLERVDDIAVAFIKKLDKSFDPSAKQREKHGAAQAKLRQAKQEYAALQKKAAAHQAELDKWAGAQKEKGLNKVKLMAAMPVLGGVVLDSAESLIPNKSEKNTIDYQLSVLLYWTPKLERAARAMATGETYVMPSKKKKGKTIDSFLEGIDWAYVVGPRTFIDDSGVRYVLGFGSAHLRATSGPMYRSAKQTAKLLARQALAYALYSDVAVQQALTQEYTTVQGEGGTILAEEDLESFAETLAVKLKDIKMPAAEDGGTVFIEDHPITGYHHMVAVKYITTSGSAAAKEMIANTYASAAISQKGNAALSGFTRGLARGLEDAKAEAVVIEKQAAQEGRATVKSDVATEERAVSQRQREASQAEEPAPSGKSQAGSTGKLAPRGGSAGGKVDLDDL